MNLRKGTTISQFMIMQPLAKGGMAEVFDAVDKKSNRKVVLKLGRNDIRDPVFSNAIRQEAMILGKLKHPGIVQVMPISYIGRIQEPIYSERAMEVPGQPWFYIMEPLQGGSLASLLGSKKKPLPLKVAAAVALSMVNTLAYLHNFEAGIAHLDIKPENILFRHALTKYARLEPVLIDFGVAVLEGGRAGGGTLPTMSPEYIDHSKQKTAPEMRIDLRVVDIYSLGIVMYKMITGEYPFSGWGNNGLETAIRRGVYKRPSELNPRLPAEVDELIAQWINRDPARRPTLAELRRDLAYLANGAGPFELTEELAAGDDKRSGGLRTII